MSPFPRPDSQTALNALKAMIQQRSVVGALEVFHRALGDIFELSLPGFTSVMLVGPEANRRVLVSDKDRFNWRMEDDPVTNLLQNGVLVVDGEQHDQLRKMMNPSLHRSAINSYLAMMWNGTDAITKLWQNGQTVDLLDEMRKITLIILTESLFGKSIEADLDRLWQTILKTLKYIGPGVWLFWKRIPRPGYKKHLENMDRYLFTLIDLRRNKPGAAPGLLDDLINAGLDNATIRDQMLTMLIAGHDTSTALLAWAFYLILTHPGAEEKVRHEIATWDHNSPPTIHNLSQLNYLGLVIDETLRLYPPIHLGSRITNQAIEILGYEIAASTRVMYSIYLTQRDPKIWENAAAFIPERFEPTRKRDIPAYAYLPFGGGSRNCIGAAFGLIEAKIILARIFQGFDLQFTGHPVRSHMGATLEPSPGVKVKIWRRD